MRIELVVWEDIFDLGDTWTTTKKALKDADKNDEYFFTQVGFILEENEHYLLMCCVHGHDKAIGPATRLPKAIIKSRKIIQE